jgi:hypothetical protein
LYPQTQTLARASRNNCRTTTPVSRPVPKIGGLTDSCSEPFIRQSVSTRLFLQGFDMQPLFRSGNLFQAVLLSSYSSNASSKAPWLHGRYPASSLLWASPTPGQSRSLGYSFPRAVGGRLPFPALPGLPGSSTDLFLRAVPNHPERSDGCLLIASPPISGFILSGGLATFTIVTRPNRVCFRYGSQVCLPGFHQPDYADSLRFSYMHERAIYMVNSFQFTRSARLSLVYQTTKTDRLSHKEPSEGRKDGALAYTE